MLLMCIFCCKKLPKGAAKRLNTSLKTHHHKQDQVISIQVVCLMNEYE